MWWRRWPGPGRVRLAVRASGPAAGWRAVGLGLGLLALGPGLRRGFLLSYDMLFVPREPFAAAVAGPGAAAGRAQRPGHRRAVPRRPGRPGAESHPAVGLRAGLLRRSPAAGPRAVAARLGGRGVLRVEPLRRRAAHHWPVGAAARLRRPALGAAGRTRARPGTAARRRPAGPGPGARGHRRVRGHGHHRAGHRGRPAGAARDVRGRGPSSPAGRGDARRVRRGLPAVAHPGAAAPGVRRPGQRGGVRGAGRHAVRHRGQFADAGRRVERADGAGRLRGSLVGGVAGGGGRGARRIPVFRPWAAALGWTLG